MRVRTALLVAALAATATLSTPAQAVAPRPYLPMAVITITGDTTTGGRAEVSAGFPDPGWSCTSSWDYSTQTFDAWCFPPAPPPGFQNVCGWVASITTVGFPIGPVGQSPTTVASCGSVEAVSGGGIPLGLTVSGQAQLTALRCRVLAPNTPPETGFSSNCNVNH